MAELGVEGIRWHDTDGGVEADIVEHTADGLDDLDMACVQALAGSEGELLANVHAVSCGVFEKAAIISAYSTAVRS